MINYPSTAQIRHIVFFKLNEGLEAGLELEALNVLQELGENEPGILEWTIQPSLDTRKGKLIVENGLFENSDALEAFRTSQKHHRAAAFMSGISDWLVGDYPEKPTPDI